ncbi:fused MFS/spermidine synthase, partial [bacterium]|nr:fused MFS/spermidine synthase [bacterium]
MSQTGVIYVLVLISGFAGLVYEIVWTRQLTLLFGVSIYAVSAVIAVFLLGLGIGSYLFGRLVDRVGKPFPIFGIIELTVAGYALVFPLVSKAIAYLYLAMYNDAFSRAEIFLIRFMLTVLLLAVPSILMGGTLPVAGKLFSRSLSQFGNAVAKLYGLNTLGAVFGAGLTGFFLLRWLGVSGATYVAVLCNGVVGATALLLASKASVSPTLTKADIPRGAKRKTRSLKNEDRALSRSVLAVVFLSGFCALGYEILWTKMLILILGNSSWAFSTVLVVFLVSLAMGSLLVAPVLDHRFNRGQLLSLLQILIAITAFFSLAAFRWMMVVPINVGSAELSHVVLRHLIRAMVVMAPPTLLSGAVLPLAAKLCTTQSEKIGSQFGVVLAFNTAGSVLGSLAAGYLFIAMFGIQNSLILLAVFNALLGVWLLYIKFPTERAPSFIKRAAAILVVMALFAAQGISKAPLSLPLPGYTLRYYKEHTAGIVSILERQPDNTKVFNLNNINEVTTHESSMITFRLMAYLPYLMHESPREALVITFGAGIVAGSLAQLDLDRLDCVEINPNAGIVGKFFADENHNAIGNPNLNLSIEDGRNFLLTSRRKYDIITADATHPTGADSWILFTKEYYELCRERLKPGGFFLQWLPLHALSE